MVEPCKKDSRYVLVGCKGRNIHLCADHRYRADFKLLIDRELLWVQMKPELDHGNRCDAPRFRVRVTV